MRAVASQTQWEWCAHEGGEVSWEPDAQPRPPAPPRRGDLLTDAPCAPADAPAGSSSAQKQKKALFGGGSVTAKTAAVSALTPKPAGQAAKKKTALATAAPKMAEEEWAALFRNNLLRSCWKPGLTSEEVQHVLTLWERKLVEVMHRWMHPDLWLAARKWKRRTWRLDLIVVMLKSVQQRQIALGFRSWRSWRLTHCHPLLKARGRRVMKRWHQMALLSKSIVSCRLKSPFAQLKQRTAAGLLRRRRMRKAIYTFRFRGVVTGFNTWEGRVRAVKENRERMRATLRGWTGGLRRTFNTWRNQFDKMGPIKQVAARWLHATMYAMFRYWSADYLGCAAPPHPPAHPPTPSRMRRRPEPISPALAELAGRAAHPRVHPPPPRLATPTSPPHTPIPLPLPPLPCRRVLVCAASSRTSARRLRTG